MASSSIPDVGFKHLNAIVSLARFGSFVAAASYLGISQPGLSRIIQQAEKKLGARLFVRGPRTATPTTAGRDFLPFAERVVGEFSEQSRKLRAGQIEARTRLSIASLMSVSHLVLPTAVVRFKESYPQAIVEVREGVGSVVNEDVRSGVVDFGIGNAGDPPPGIATESVMEESFYVVLPATHPLAEREIVRITDLKDVPQISMPPESGLRRAVDNAAAKAGVDLIHSIVTNQYGSLFGFVANGLGATIVPSSALPSGSKTQLAVRALNPVITRQIGIMHLAERPLNAVSEALLRLLRPLLINATEGSRNFAPGTLRERNPR